MSQGRKSFTDFIDFRGLKAQAQPVADDSGERGRNWSGHTRGSSIYTKAFLHPRVAEAAVAAVIAGVAAPSLLGRRFSRSVIESSHVEPGIK